MNPLDALTALWSLGGLPPQALAGIALAGRDPVFPSSFAVGTAAQASIAAAALATTTQCSPSPAPTRASS